MAQNRRHLLVLAKSEPSEPAPFNYYGRSKHPFFAEYMKTGWYALWKKMRKDKTIMTVTVVVRSSRFTGSYVPRDGIKFLCVPDLKDLNKLLHNDWLPSMTMTILAHGNQDGWAPWLTDRIAGRKYWVMGIPDDDGSLPPCQIVLDPHASVVSTGERITWPFMQPLNEDTFHMTSFPPNHPIDIAVKDDTGKIPLDMLERIDAQLQRTVIRMAVTDKMHTAKGSVYTQSRILLYSGHRPDRILEALACGCLVVAMTEQPFAHHTPGCVFTSSDPQEVEATLVEWVKNYTHSQRMIARQAYMDYGDVETVVIPQFAKLINLLYGHIRADVDWLKEALDGNV